MVYYAVAVGRKIGIFETVKEYNEQVKGYSGSKAKKFAKRSDALKFLEENKETDAGGPGGPKSSNNEPLSAIRKMPTRDAVQDRFRTPPLPAPINPSKHASSRLQWSVNAKEGTKRPVNDQPINNNYAPLGPMCDRHQIMRQDQAIVHRFAQIRQLAFVIGPDVVDMREDGLTIRVRGEDAERCRHKKTAFNQVSVLENNKPLIGNGHGGKISVLHLGQGALGHLEFDIEFVQAVGISGDVFTAAGFGVYWDDAHPDNMASPVDGSADTFRGCLQATVHAIRTALRRGHAKLVIYTDDQELHRCVAKRMKGWKERQCKRDDGLPIPHADLLQQLDALRQQVEVKFDFPENSKLGARGQRFADRLALEGAERYPISG